MKYLILLLFPLTGCIFVLSNVGENHLSAPAQKAAEEIDATLAQIDSSVHRTDSVRWQLMGVSQVVRAELNFQTMQIESLSRRNSPPVR